MADPMTPERIAEVRAREQAATNGPWSIWDGPEYVGGGRDLCIGAGETWVANMDHRMCRNYAHHVCCPGGCGQEGDTDICSVGESISAEQQANAQFLAHARQDIPDLLDALVQAQQEIADLRAGIGTLAELWHGASVGGMKAFNDLHARQAYEAAQYERGKADARGFCADSLSALLAPRTPKGTD